MRTATRHRPNVGWLRRTALAVIAACVAATITIGGAPAGASTDAGTPACRPVEVAVSLSDGGAPTARLVGQVCYPTADVAALHGTVQVLVSGTAYGQSYWDFPYEPDTYSYVRAAARAGFTTFTFDRIGIGQSTHPLSTEVTIPANAATIHQAISQLRAGSVDGVHYARVVIVGHSLGSLISLYEAGTYHDVDAVVASGILHSFDPTGVARFVTTLYPAALDPKFFGSVVDPGYLTTVPGTREASFYYPPNTDPAVVATDESLKETATVPEAAGVFAQELPGVLQPASQIVCTALATLCDGVASSLVYGITRQITVPVVEVVGQYDALLCGGASGANRCSDVAAVRQDESGYFRGIAQRCLTVAELPQSGHDVNLERNAPSWFAVANEWSAFTVQHAADGDAADCWSDNGQSGLLFPG
jgi:pimeloyl-ACP methyl ester carboxylesterase